MNCLGATRPASPRYCRIQAVSKYIKYTHFRLGSSLRFVRSIRRVFSLTYCNIVLTTLYHTTTIAILLCSYKMAPPGRMFASNICLEMARHTDLDIADATANTPLAPSVEKAYYRKCIELKRRLNEVEEANDAARLRKQRLERAISKMRLERAFLLEQMAKRMQFDVADEEPNPTNPESPSQPAA